MDTLHNTPVLGLECYEAHTAYDRLAGRGLCLVRPVAGIVGGFDFRETPHAGSVDLGDGVLERLALDIFLDCPVLDRKRLRQAVLTRIGDGCDCGRSCPQILKWTRPMRKMALYVEDGLLISSVQISSWRALPTARSSRSRSWGRDSPLRRTSIARLW